MSTDENMLANTAYHSALVSGLAVDYARLRKMAFKGAKPKLDIKGYDLGMVGLDVAMAIAEDMLMLTRDHPCIYHEVVSYGA